MQFHHLRGVPTMSEHRQHHFVFLQATIECFMPSKCSILEVINLLRVDISHFLGNFVSDSRVPRVSKDLLSRRNRTSQPIGSVEDINISHPSSEWPIDPSQFLFMDRDSKLVRHSWLSKLVRLLLRRWRQVLLWNATMNTIDCQRNAVQKCVEVAPNDLVRLESPNSKQILPNVDSDGLFIQVKIPGHLGFQLVGREPVHSNQEIAITRFINAGQPIVCSLEVIEHLAADVRMRAKRSSKMAMLDVRLHALHALTRKPHKVQPKLKELFFAVVNQDHGC